MLLHQKMMRDAEVATAYQLMTLGASHYFPVDSNRRIICAKGRDVRASWCHLADTWRHLVLLSGHLALIDRCKWRDEDFKHFKIFVPPN